MALPVGELANLRMRLQRAMSRHVAVVRDASGLAEAAREIAAVAQRVNVTPENGGRRVGAHLRVRPGQEDGTPAWETVRAVWELANMTLAASAVVAAASRREESRGAHFRSDFPTPDPALDGRHLIHVGVDSWYGALADVLRPTEVAAP